ncbi:HORMA domain containing protein [Stigmatella sp. ncwal1]|uniref:HORMA domain containing protein n=1 Tax=Stigmatella ashevillensis TaxID=2995309 RepID=A0ABT5DGN7_9BACT|nr:HORMA domain containing protein [Stigmatella ashevillena]MDC0712686.1 HORMA domain containing protein [Stigmatella ashevillena]
MTSVAVYSYTHSVTYVADNILKSLKEIIRQSGLSMTHLVDKWNNTLNAIRIWIESGHLELVVLEIFHPQTSALLIRWDIRIVYEWAADAGSFWTDTEHLSYHIKKAGVLPSEAHYRILLQTKPGCPDIDGWVNTSYRSTAGMVRQSLGSTVEHSGLSAQAGYWRQG